MAKEFVISTSSVNCYGTRFLTEGIDTTQYQRNPVLLYMHVRGFDGERLPIGRVENLHTDGDRLIGTPVFDMEDEFAAKIARKWDNDFLRMGSAGLEPVESSSDAELLLPGQTRATVTKSKLVEISIVDIGGNDDALRLYGANGKVVTLAAGADCDLVPLLKTEPVAAADPAPGEDTNDNLTTFSMEKIFLALGLAATATESDALAAITKLQADAGRVATIELARIEGVVDAAIAAGKTTADKRDKFIGLGKAAGFEHLTGVLDELTPVVKPMQLVNPGAGSSQSAPVSQAYSEMSESQLADLRANDPEAFVKLFKAEFGVAPDLR